MGASSGCRGRVYLEGWVRVSVAVVGGGVGGWRNKGGGHEIMGSLTTLYTYTPPPSTLKCEYFSLGTWGGRVV